MAPLGDKNLMEYYGKPLCVHLLQRAMKGGVTSFIIVTNSSNRTAIAKIVVEWKIPATIAEQQDLSAGMAGGISDALVHVSPNDPVVIIGGNDAVDPSAYADVIAKINKNDGAILAKKVTEYFPGGYISVNEKGIVRRIIEKPGAGNEPSNMVNIVCHGFARAKNLSDALQDAASEADDVYEVALQNLFENGKYAVVEYEKSWQAVKYPWHVLDMKKALWSIPNKRIHPSAEVHSSAVIGDEVILDAGVRVMPFATVTGKTYIGQNSLIGNNALIIDSHVEKNSTIGNATEMTRTTVGHNFSTHKSYIGDSIIGDSVNMGAFSCTANMRLDQQTVRVGIKGEKTDSGKEKLGAIIGDGAQIGIHASLMPGVKIESLALVPPRAIV